MNKAETLRLMTVLSAVYGQGNANVNAMAEVWYLILKDYDYITAEKAVLRFMKEDNREYCAYPSPGRIVKAIEKEQSALFGMRNKALRGANYNELTDAQRSWVTPEEYERLKELDEQTLTDGFDAMKMKIVTKATPLLEGR